MLQPEILQLPKIPDDRGNLSIIEDNRQIPFKIKRTYWVYDVPGGEKRGAHAYHDAQEFIVALSGSFNITINDGKNEQTFHLNRSYYGLFLPKMTWRQLDNFSTNSLALVLTDYPYDSLQYIRNFNEFVQLKNA